MRCHLNGAGGRRPGEAADYKEAPTRVDYSLTSLGHSLAQALVPLCEWGTQNMAHVNRVFAARDAGRLAEAPAQR